MSADDSLRSRQVVAIERMLALNKVVQPDASDANLLKQDIIWKVLVLDKKSTNIVSSILSVNDLLNTGITMHTLINSPSRAALPDVPAIYFIQPTKENILKIVEDLEKDFYSEYYINFLSSLDRELLEEFANLVSLTGRSQKVKQVFDQYLDYLVTEPQLFSLDLQGVYSKLNTPAVTEDEITKIADSIASGLFNLIITLNTVPIIRAPRGGPAEFVAQKLDAKLRDHVINMKSISPSTAYSSHGHGDSRQVLVLLDRNIDLSAMFAHSWIYSCMISDVFQLNRNTIVLQTVDSDTGTTKSKKCYIDGNDFFWEQNSASPFPEVVENIEKEASEYRNKAADLTNKTGVTSLSDIDPNQSDTYQIQQAIKQLPELTAKKQVIDTHMSILDALLKQLQANNLDVFFEVEQTCKKDNQSKVEADFLEKLKNDKSESNKNDKLRTYLILYLSLDLSSEFTQKVESILQGLNCDLSALAYIKKVKEIVTLSSLSSGIDSNENTSANSGSIKTSLGNAAGGSLFSGISSKLFDGSTLTSGVGSIISGLKTLLPEKQTMPITNLVESIMEPARANQVTLNTTDDYLYFDPTIVRGNHSKLPKRSTYHQSVVFVVGGGNYLEYQNLQEWATGLNVDSSSTGIKRSVIYGSTAIINPNDFLEECGSLGRPSDGASHDLL
ncbi:syntaxin-binding protein [Saccharomycopsis crataegensis]|uniref:Syntaxin-binding protein n=1 Tax=Saccharomycopsis crataegensis TaxID=43959 RepID=A0AAV5QH47_9ASCO|nr:syntaxin-binding protein [Saccharomycopsis crataegensis]